MDLPGKFETLMNKSPISSPDVTSFLREVRRTPSGTLLTSKLLSGKIQSTSEAQAIQAFDVLEACLSSESEGSIEFRTEVGRYRFLNEVIRILSPKYLGDKTPTPVKERATKFLEDAAGVKRRQWFPSEHSKILAVYNSLVDGGVVKKPAKFPTTIEDEEAELQKSIFDRAENAAVLKRLLQSKDPSDLQAANRLIKNLVEEESKRIQRRAELHSLLDRIETSSSLLSEMLSQKRIDREIVDELVDTCQTLRQKLGGVATETNEEATSLLYASECLEKVLQTYEDVKDKKTDEVEVEAVGEESTSGAGLCSPPISLSLADELLLQLDLENVQDNKTSTSSKSVGDCSDNLLKFDMEFPNASKNTTVTQMEKPKCPLEEIGKMSRELMNQSLLGNNSTSMKLTANNTPVTPVSKITQPSKEIDSSHSKSSQRKNESVSLLDFDLLENKVSQQTSVKSDLPFELDSTAVLVDLGVSSPPKPLRLPTTTVNGSLQPTSNKKEIPRSPSDSESIETRQFLNSVKNIDLDKIELCSVKPLELSLGDEVPLTLSITFGTVPELPGTVRVGVVTLTNRHPSSGLCNYVFQLMPPKSVQTKLLPPTAMELPAWRKSFLPPPVLTQVALIVIPRDFNINTTSNKNVRYILSYTTDEDTALHNGDFEIPAELGSG